MPRGGAVVSVVVAFATIVWTLPAQGATDAQRARFAGSCQVHANVRFSPPLGNAPASGRDIASGAGTCTGAITMPNGQTTQLTDVPARYGASDRGVSSCVAADMVGSASVSVGHMTLRYALHEVRGGAAAALVLDGDGRAVGSAVVAPTVDPVTVVNACSTTGLTRAPVDISIRTVQ